MTAGVLGALAVLVLLGNWQWEKFEEKMAREAAPPPSFASVSVSVEGIGPVDARQVYGLVEGEAVWRRYVPGRIDGVGDPVLMLWDATSGPEPVPLSIAGLGTVERESAILVRPVERGYFSAPDDPDSNRWYTFDGQALMRAFGYAPEGDVRVVEPAEITLRLAEDTTRSRTTRNPFAELKPVDPLPPQRHFGYAITWWGLAAALIGVYLAFHAARGRLRFRSEG